jgi:hypothetical protein
MMEVKQQELQWSNKLKPQLAYASVTNLSNGRDTNMAMLIVVKKKVMIRFRSKIK